MWGVGGAAFREGGGSRVCLCVCVGPAPPPPRVVLSFKGAKEIFDWPKAQKKIWPNLSREWWSRGAGVGGPPPPRMATCGLSRVGGVVDTVKATGSPCGPHEEMNSVFRAGERPQAPFAHRPVENGQNEDHCAWERRQHPRLSCDSPPPKSGASPRSC